MNKTIQQFAKLLLVSSITFGGAAYADVPATVDIKVATSSDSSVDLAVLKAADQLWADKKVDEAISAYKQVIEQHPDNKMAYQRLAGLYLMNNKSLEAIEAYQDAITHDSENPKLFASLSIAYLHQGKYSMAKAMASEAVRLDPKMESVKKILKYVDKKEEVLEKASAADQVKMPPHGAALSNKKMTEESIPHSLPDHAPAEK